MKKFEDIFSRTAVGYISEVKLNCDAIAMRHAANYGGDVWILGYKTERGGTLLDTCGGGRTETLGGFSYTTTAGKLAPMFVN